MEISTRGLELIKKSEGLRLQAYQDVIGKWTIGYGHLIKLPEEKGLLDFHISETYAENLLLKDVQDAVKCVNDKVLVLLTQSQFDALVSFTFNLGCGALNRSTLLRLLNAGEYARASEQFLLWDKAGGKPVAGLSIRRQEEKRMFDES